MYGLNFVLTSRYSDLDVNAHWTGDDPNAKELKIDRLKILTTVLSKCQGVERMQNIPTATVPIVKLNIKGYDVDLSANSPGVACMTEWVLGQLESYPYLRSLALLIKSIFQRQGLTETQYGGFSGTNIFILLSGFAKVSWYINTIATERG